MTTTPSTPAAQASQTGSAEIYDRGYRAYDGPRAGNAGAMGSVFMASVQRALGLRRKFRFKLVPIATIVIAYLPAIAFMGIAILLPAEFAGELVPEYAGYYGLISMAMVLFTAFVAPELLSTDRRTGMFGIYMASPLNRVHYLVAKLGALLAVLLTVTMFPVVFLMLGYTFSNLGPEGFGETVKTLGQIFAGGFVIALFWALFGMAAATLTTRQGFASAGIVMVIIASSILSNVLVEVAGAPSWVSLFDFGGVPFDVVARIFDEPGEQIDDVSTTASVAMYCAMCAVCAAVLTFGYRRLQVTK